MAGGGRIRVDRGQAAVPGYLRRTQVWVWVDDGPEAGVGPGHHVEFEVEPGLHQVSAWAGLSSSNTLQVNVTPEETVRIRILPGVQTSMFFHHRVTLVAEPAEGPS